MGWLKVTIILMLFISYLTASSGNRIYPITPGVGESINKLLSSTKDTDNKLSEPLKKLDKQLTFFSQNCGATGKLEDSGCQSQMSQIKNALKSVFDIMAKDFPIMEKNIDNTLKDMDRNIQIYKKQTNATELWNDINSKSVLDIKLPKGRLGLASSLQHIAKALQNSPGNQSLVKAGLDTYSELQSAKQLLQFINGQVSLQQQSLSLPDALLFGQAEQFASTIGSAMDLLYGTGEESGYADYPTKETEKKAWYE